jgi:hypothetical protein
MFLIKQGKQGSPTMKIALRALLVSLVVSSGAFAAGFDRDYTIHRGDFNNDGLMDLYIKAPGTVILPFEDIPIVIPPSVRAFVLQNSGAGSFTVVSTLTPAQRNTMNQWPQVAFGVMIRDVNQDGRDDLDLTDIKSEIPNALDHIIYADQGRGRTPLGLTTKTAKFNKYHEDLLHWLINDNYFEDYAPLRVVGVEPSSREWQFSVFNPTNIIAIGTAMSLCRALNPNSFCGISNQDPSPCNRDVVLVDENGVTTGSEDNSNVCRFDVHVYAYGFGTVTLQKDYSVFDPEARETAEILRRLNQNCSALSTQDGNSLQNITDSIYGGVVANISGSVNVPNSFPHAPFPGDVLFSTNDRTFHHYDVVTKVCDASQPSCNMTTIKDDALRHFTFPNFKLKEMVTTRDGFQRVGAYISPPWATSNKEAYVIAAGPVSQQVVTSPPWAGATQNITDVNHIVYPGTISRYIQQNGSSLEVFTHGVGINRAFCTLMPQFRPLNMLLAFSNDVFGPKAFGQLDKEMIKYYKRHYVPPFTGETEIPCSDPNNGCLVAPKP